MAGVRLATVDPHVQGTDAMGLQGGLLAFSRPREARARRHRQAFQKQAHTYLAGPTQAVRGAQQLWRGPHVPCALHAVSQRHHRNVPL